MVGVGSRGVVAALLGVWVEVGVQSGVAGDFGRCPMNTRVGKSGTSAEMVGPPFAVESERTGSEPEPQLVSISLVPVLVLVGIEPVPVGIVPVPVGMDLSE